MVGVVCYILCVRCISLYTTEVDESPNETIAANIEMVYTHWIPLLISNPMVFRSMLMVAEADLQALSGRDPW